MKWKGLPQLDFQHLDAEGGYQESCTDPDLNPFRALVLAALQDCVTVLQIAHKHKGLVLQREYDLLWIQDRSDRPFSFIWCCQALQLNPTTLRAYLLRLVKDQEAAAQVSTRFL